MTFLKLVTFCLFISAVYASTSLDPTLSSADVLRHECIRNPKSDSCRDFIYIDELAKKDITWLCSAVPGLVGCSLYKKCHGREVSSKYCKPMSILASICKVDHAIGKSMSGCAAYNSVCQSGSKVQQCVDNPPVPALFDTSNAEHSAVRLCREAPNHEKHFCEKCESDFNCPDSFSVVSNLCKNNPKQFKCKGWKEMCIKLSQDGQEHKNFARVCGDKFLTEKK